MSAPICDHGCLSANVCTGQCQPAPRKFSNKRCKWCEAGNLRRDDEHWIVKSFSPPTIDIRKCVAVAP